MKTIFVVDDNDVNLLSSEAVLSNYYRVFTFSVATAMFEFLENIIPNLIMLDIEMPVMNGFEALERLKSDKRYADIPVIFLPSRKDISTEVKGFEMGAIDFVHKPFSKPILLNRIKSHLDIDELIHEQTYILHRLKNSIVSALANLVESRDSFTGQHIKHTTKYLRILLDEMLKRGVYYNEISSWDIDEVVSSSRLHDVGKIAIGDLILNKPGRLTPEEFDIIKNHSPEGEKIIDEIIEESGHGSFLHHAKMFAGCHHERWDGSGYPRQIKEVAIPLQGRVMAIADVYDALVSKRAYKNAFTHEEAVEIIKEGKGSHFDPKIVDVFLEINSLFAEVE